MLVGESTVDQEEPSYLIIVPEAPTAQPSEEESIKTEFRSSLVGEEIADQEEPSHLIIVPKAPTPKPKEEEERLIP